MQRFCLNVVLGNLFLGLCGCPTTGGNNGGNDNTGNDNNEPLEAVNFLALLTAEQETDPVATDAQGLGSFTLNAERTALTFNLYARDLSGPVTAAHLHVAPQGVSGAIVFVLTPFLTETDGEVEAAGTAAIADFTIDDAVDQLLDGNIYVNLHTDLGPAGEIRGQLTPG